MTAPIPTVDEILHDFELDNYWQIESFTYPNAEPIFRSISGVGWELHLHHTPCMRSGVPSFSFQLKIKLPDVPGKRSRHIDITDTQNEVSKGMWPLVDCILSSDLDSLKITSVHQLAALWEASIIFDDVASQQYFKAKLEWWLLSVERTAIRAWACASRYNLPKVKAAALKAYLEDPADYSDMFELWEVQSVRWETFREIPYKEVYGKEPPSYTKPVGRRGRSETAVDPRLYRVDTTHKHSDDRKGLGIVVPVPCSPIAEEHPRRPTVNAHPAEHTTLEGEPVPVWRMTYPPCPRKIRKLYEDVEDETGSAKELRRMPLLPIGEPRLSKSEPGTIG